MSSWKPCALLRAKCICTHTTHDVFFFSTYTSRAVVRELPRVMTIYDVDIPLKTARAAISYHFRKNERLEDGRVIGLLIAKGYMELEETLKQWKQKTHLLRILEVRVECPYHNGRDFVATFFNRPCYPLCFPSPCSPWSSNWQRSR